MFIYVHGQGQISSAQQENFVCAVCAPKHDHSSFEKLHLNISILFQVEIDMPA